LFYPAFCVDIIKPMPRLKGLYAITDERLTPNDSICAQVKECLLGGASIIQLRNKTAPDSELFDIALELKRLCREYGAFFIINDRVRLAREVGADGVHIGKDDTDYKKAREILGQKAIIGVSCYNEIERALEAFKLGADYVAFGSFFPSPTKPEAVKAPMDLLKKAKKELDIPICVIGGITASNVKKLIAYGADMAAVITDLWTAPDIKAKAQEFCKCFDAP